MKTSTNKRDIGAAFKALKVNEPYNLKHTKPAFVQPEPVDSTLVAYPTPVALDTAVVKLTQVEIPTAVTLSTPVGKQTPVSFHTRDEKLTEVVKSTPVGNNTQANYQSEESNQRGAIELETRVTPSLERGYTRIPNTLLMKLCSEDFTRNEIKLALMIARFTISFKRDFAPLSKTVLARLTHLREPAILEAIGGLVSKAVVQKIQGNQNKPNQLGLILPSDWDSPQTQVAKPTPTQVGKVDPTLVGNPTPFKNNINIINSPSPSSFTSPLLKITALEITDYLSSIKAPKKRESEAMACGTLLEVFSEEQIATALDFILGHGSLHDQTPCHSPMKYLCLAMDQVLKTVEIQAEDKKIKQEKREILEAQKQMQIDKENLEELEASEREKAFLEAFPEFEKQQEVITKFTPIESKLLPERIQRILAIEKWFGSDDLNEKQGGI